MGRVSRFWIGLLAASVIVIQVAPVMADPVEPDFTGDSVMLVVDVSGSMSGTPLVQAKDALHATVASLDDAVAVGLRSYAGSCGNGGIRLVDVGLDNRAELDAAIDGLSAGGGTPTPDALRAAVADLPPDGQRSIVLVSDGVSTCGSACAVASELVASETVDFTVFTVGFNAPASAAADLTCVADTTGGTYVEATDTETLIDAINGAVGGTNLTLRALPQYSVVVGDVAGSAEIQVRVKVERPDGANAVGAIVSVDGEISGVTDAAGVTTVSVFVTSFWLATHPSGEVQISAELGDLTGGIASDVLDLQHEVGCAYDGPPKRSNNLGFYLEFVSPGAPGKVGKVLEWIWDGISLFGLGSDAIEELKPKEVETDVVGYIGTQGVYDPLYFVTVTVSQTGGPLSSSQILVSKDAGLVDGLRPDDLPSRLSGNCHEGPMA